MRKETSSYIASRFDPDQDTNSKVYKSMRKRKHPYITFDVVCDDVLTFEADVLALKFAQALYGADRVVAERLFDNSGVADPMVLFPKPHGFKLLSTKGKIAATDVLFVGVEPLREFEYKQIREFGRKVLVSLAGAAPKTKTLGVTIHGPGYGLDESESFEAEIAGFLDALTSGDFPEDLEQITIVERNNARSRRLKNLLDELISNRRVPIDGHAQTRDLGEASAERLRAVGYASESKPNVFVAMPFAEDMDDVFHYGIQGAVNSAGFLCERADLSSFTGDVMEWVKKRIATASLIIADLSTANPNVYLEVGYAWGCGKPTVLLVRDTNDLRFDVRTQRCLVYKKIKDLESLLRTELANLPRA